MKEGGFRKNLIGVLACHISHVCGYRTRTLSSRSHAATVLISLKQIWLNLLSVQVLFERNANTGW